MKYLTLVAAVCLLALCGSIASANLPPLQVAHPDIKPMRFMLGTWTCSGAAMDGTAFHITDTTVLSADGSRLITHDSKGETQTDLYYDVAQRQWVQTSVNSANGSSSNESSPGWTGNRLVFNGQLQVKGLPTVAFRSTITKVSDTKTQQGDDLMGPTGTWITFDTATCEKSPS